MGNFECNSIEDLVFNRSFREWVLHPAAAEASFWESWVKNNPGKDAIINQSKAIIYALQLNLKGLSDESINNEISKIILKLHTDEDASTECITDEEYKRPGIVTKTPFRFLSAAAIAGLVIIIAGFLLRGTFTKKDTVSYESFISARKTTVVELLNSTDTTQLITLPDESRVYLEKQSKLNYTRDFSGNKREVFLTGAAFFEVKKNPLRPFLVYTSSIITKVLGTSFRVRAYPSDKKAVITVKTGKVSVFKSQNFDEGVTNGKTLGGIVLTPNQEVIYTIENNELNKKLAEQPLVVATPPQKAFVFDATPVRQVFKVMQDTYNIAIVYDEDIMAGCSLSARMGDESFYEKLNLICKAINASYEMIDGQIVIISKGCKPSVNK
jgi:transmembrane sensor